jgi:hypothetical protein
VPPFLLTPKGIANTKHTRSRCRSTQGLTHLCCLLLQPVRHVWPQLLLQVQSVPPLLLRPSNGHLNLACGSRTGQGRTGQDRAHQHNRRLKEWW